MTVGLVRGQTVHSLSAPVCPWNWTNLIPSLASRVFPWNRWRYCPARRQRSRERPAGARPHILFLLSDDQRWNSLGCRGDPVLKTPHLDALVREGTLFTHACVTTEFI